jgi:hypothetical protein
MVDEYAISVIVCCKQMFYRRSGVAEDVAERQLHAWRDAFAKGIISWALSKSNQWSRSRRYPSYHTPVLCAWCLRNPEMVRDVIFARHYVCDSNLSYLALIFPFSFTAYSRRLISPQERRCQCGCGQGVSSAGSCTRNTLRRYSTSLRCRACDLSSTCLLRYISRKLL